MNVNSWLKKAKTAVDFLDAELILLEVLGLFDRSELVLYDSRELSDDELRRADEMLAERKSGVPLAYIFGRKEFYGRTFVVNRNTLIPRPETENCVDMIWRRFTACTIFSRGASLEPVGLRPSASQGAVVTGLVRSCVDASQGAFVVTSASSSKKHARGSRHQSYDNVIQILDVGTGSGCIGITLALEIPEAEVVAIDVSKEALKVARKNAERLGAENVEFLESDLLQNYSGPKPDVIVANLPYVDREWDWLSPELAAEPDLALYAENRGLALIYRLLDEIKQKWYNSKYDVNCSIYLEADPCQHPQIIKYAQSLGFEHSITNDFIIELAF